LASSHSVLIEQFVFFSEVLIRRVRVGQDPKTDWVSRDDDNGIMIIL